MSNSSFKAVTDDGTFVITILNNHQDSPSPTLLIDLPNHLSSHGIHVDEVLMTLDGDMRSVKSIPVIVKRYIEGFTPDGSSLDELLALSSEVGKLHQIPTLEIVKNMRRRLPSDWRELTADSISGSADFLSRYMTRAESLYPGSTLDQHPQVLCHGDLFPDNTIMSTDGDLFIIDWETAAFDSAYLDLGVMLVGWWDAVQKNGLTHTFEAVIEAYKANSMSPPTVRELKEATYYGAAVLMFHRYYRHNVRLPNHDYADFYMALAPMMDSLWESIHEARTEAIRLPLAPI